MKEEGNILGIRYAIQVKFDISDRILSVQQYKKR